MFEGPSEVPEKKIERIPGPEEICEAFEKVLEGKRYETIRKEEDDKGIAQWNVVVESKEGRLEYEYIRAAENRITSIHRLTETKKSWPAVVAKYENGEWQFIT